MGLRIQASRARPVRGKGREMTADLRSGHVETSRLHPGPKLKEIVLSPWGLGSCKVKKGHLTVS